MEKWLAEKIIKDVEKTLKERIKVKSNKSEVDYLAGAMAVIVAIEKRVFETEKENLMQNIPPRWIFNGMAGKSIFGDSCEHNNTITNECSDCNEEELFDDMLDYTLCELRDMLVGGSNNILSDIVESYQKHGGFQDNELMNKVEKETMRRLSL